MASVTASGVTARAANLVTPVHLWMSVVGSYGPRMPEHKWAPPEHPDVTLHQPATLARTATGELRTLDPVAPVWADIEFVGVGVLHLKCFAAAESDRAVLVQTAWQGRLQQVLVSRDKVTRRALNPRTR